jgi:hypothetical protein
VAAAVVVAAIVLVGAAAVGRTAARVTEAPGSGSLDDLAGAVANALHVAGLTGRGGDAVRVEAQADGGYRARLEEVPAAESALFAEALDEVLVPLSQPRYVIPRLILPPPASRPDRMYRGLTRPGLGVRGCAGLSSCLCSMRSWCRPR